jgi:hypothetical protein
VADGTSNTAPVPLPWSEATTIALTVVVDLRNKHGENAIRVEHAHDVWILVCPPYAARERSGSLETLLLLQGGQGQDARQTDDREGYREGEGNGIESWITILTKIGQFL